MTAPTWPNRTTLAVNFVARLDDGTSFTVSIVGSGNSVIGALAHAEHQIVNITGDYDFLGHRQLAEIPF